ncbi:alpha/beta fold hydrolase [Micrococcus lylae]|uniref:Alpha/beta hydrolase n=1 Tax=Micrococcus lylae TaxID=1273 RepID=A0ABY2K0E8_9MICC|nr:alpha/beta hydrolase [Micrococcus lylae]TFH99791.1 alpha/beta hydrolase [Micrococcus lylae]
MQTHGARPSEAPPVRLRDRLCPPSAGDPSQFTGAAVREPVHHTVQVTDPTSGACLPVAVFEYLPEGRTTARTVVFVHGFRGDHHGLALLADCLPGDRILAVDLPGFGASAAFPAAEHSVAHHAGAVAEAVDQLQVPGDAVLLGHSYGSIVAAHLAGQDPWRWSALVLLNPISEPALSANGSVVDRLTAGVAQGYYEVAARLPERLGDAILRARPITWLTTLLMSETADVRILAHTHDQHLRHFSRFATRASLAQAYRASTTGSVVDSADRLALPVLLVAGTEDPMGSPASQQALAERIGVVSPRVSLAMLPGVGHLLHYEKAPECAALLEGFLAG